MSALRVPAFRRLAVAWGFSNFGDSALYLTLAIWVKDLTDSDAAAGFVFLFLGLPFFLAPLAGQLADRASRRKVVVVANIVSALGVLTLGLVDGRSQVWLIYLVTFVYGSLTYVTGAAGAGLVRDLLADDQLASGNALLNTTDQALRLASPLVGAGAYALWGGFAIAGVTSVMLLTAAAVASTVKVVESPPTTERSPFRTEVTAGFRHLRSVPLLARLTLATAAAFGITGLANVVVFALVDEGLGRDSEFFAVLAAIQGAGAVVGGLTAAAVIRRLGERNTVALAIAMLGVFLGVAAIPEVIVVSVCMAMIGLSIPWQLVAFTTLRQKMTPARLQGRVSSATNMALNGPQTAGTALGAVLVALVDYRILVVAMGVGVLLCAIPVVGRTDVTVVVDDEVESGSGSPASG
ncbi:MAG: MFS transporter [Ilumatobacteraceae bacterium]